MFILLELTARKVGWLIRRRFRRIFPEKPFCVLPTEALLKRKRYQGPIAVIYARGRGDRFRWRVVYLNRWITKKGKVVEANSFGLEDQRKLTHLTYAVQQWSKTRKSSKWLLKNRTRIG